MTELAANFVVFGFSASLFAISVGSFWVVNQAMREHSLWVLPAFYLGGVTFCMSIAGFIELGRHLP